MQFSPYRIEKPSKIGAQAGGDRAEDDAARYVERLARLIPAEVLGIYLTFRGLAGPGSPQNNGGVTDSPDLFALSWPVICFALVILSRIWGSRPPGTSVSKALSTAQWPVVFISTVSFVLWVYATGDSFFNLTIEDQRWISAGVGVWTLIIPWFYRGTKAAGDRS